MEIKTLGKTGLKVSRLGAGLVEIGSFNKEEAQQAGRILNSALDAGINFFDTANVYYYNEGVDVVEELRQIARYVAAVHLKDTNGGFKTWHFPALGDGVVDFPSLFEVLEAVSYQGPLTLEIEGIEGETLTEEIARTRVEQSLAYLDRLGLTGGE
mgnify:CR=1 FL=1